MRKTCVRLGAAGLALAGVTAALPATAAAQPFTHGGGIHADKGRNVIRATGWIKDRTSGRDFVAVQTFIERHTGKGWVTVVKGARRTGNNFARSTIRFRTCTNGRLYRARVNYNWNNRPKYRFHSYTHNERC